MVDTVATTALTSASALADADEVIVNQSSATKRGVMTLISDYIASKLWGAWTAYTPTVAGSTPAGSGFAATVNNARYKKVGRRVEVIFDIAVTNLGSGPSASGTLNVSAPVAAAYRSSLGAGKEYGSTNKGLTCAISASSSTIVVTIADNSSTALSAVPRSFSAGIVYEASA